MEKENIMAHETEAKIFKSNITKQLKTKKSLLIVVIELITTEKTNIEHLYGIFSKRIGLSIPMKVYKGRIDNKDGNKYLRVVLVAKSTNYLSIAEKTRYSSNEYFPLTVEIASVWNKLLFDGKAFPKDVTGTFSVLDTKVLNGVNLSAMQVETVADLLHTKLTDRRDVLIRRTTDIKHISLSLLSGLEFNDKVIPTGYLFEINSERTIDINEASAILTFELNKVNLKYATNLIRKKDKGYVISIFIFEGDEAKNHTSQLIDAFNIIGFTNDDITLLSHLIFLEIEGIIDPRNYSNVKLLAEDMYNKIQYTTKE